MTLKIYIVTILLFSTMSSLKGIWHEYNDDLAFFSFFFLQTIIYFSFLAMRYFCYLPGGRSVLGKVRGLEYGPRP